MDVNEVKLTAYSHGAGCGCKIAPGTLKEILSGSYAQPENNKLLVGNHSHDDAAVYDLGNGQCLISTTDFFMPIVDDAFDFGRIASANAISDIYAMGGTPIVAIAILGWPIQKLAPSLARRVIEGARAVCADAGIPLAGGHSIDSPEPIFGLAVNGLVSKERIKKNNTARDGDFLYLTKKIGVGILTTAEKRGKLRSEDYDVATAQMIQLNNIGTEIGLMKEVNALTDVTGFGLLGHLHEMTTGSQVGAILNSDKVALISANIEHYITEGCIPGGSQRNWDSYGSFVNIDDKLDHYRIRSIFCDPQTSGGLLISISPDGADRLEQLLHRRGLGHHAAPIGRIVGVDKGFILVT